MCQMIFTCTEGTWEVERMRSSQEEEEEEEDTCESDRHEYD